MAVFTFCKRTMKTTDPKLRDILKREVRRQEETIALIASENYCSPAVLSALSSPFSNKYAEGYPKRRYYKGNAVADDVELLAQQRALKLFGLSPEKWGVNVQPYSGSPANLAVYLALVPPGEKVMGMQLSMGGHLTHGHKVSATGKLWHQIPYGVSKEKETLDYEELRALAKAAQPKMIIAGYTAYPRKIDFRKFREVADAAGAYLLVDMSHVAGLVAGKAYPSPFPYADVVMTTTHKTLRGPRGAMLFSRAALSDKIDKAVFPGLQGGPHMNQIAALAQALYEAAQPAFRRYATQIVLNAKALSSELQRLGWRIVSGGTDSHLLLVDTGARGIGGKEASDTLEQANIVTNMNTVPYDERPPMDPSGIRLGTPAVTTRGMKEREMKKIAEWIHAVLLKKQSPALVQKSVRALCGKFRLPYV